MERDIFSDRMQWARLLLSVITVCLLITIVVQIYVATNVSAIRAAIFALQEQMKTVEGALIIKDKDKDKDKLK